MTGTKNRNRSRGLVLAMLAFAALLYLRTAPVDISYETPLLWDQSSHYLGALQMSEAISNGSLLQVLRLVFASDLYPPLHSIVAGTWFVAWGSAPVAWLSLGLGLYLLTTAMLLRVHPLGAATFLMLSSVLAVAPTLMVEPVAIALLVATLISLDRAQRRKQGWRGFAFVGLLGGATILSKYNVGLPLLISVPVSAIVCTPRRRWRYAALTTLIIAGAMVAFLALQDNGLYMFREFARNRSNSVDMSSWQRLVWYGRAFVEKDGGWTGIALLLPMAALSLPLRQPAVRRETQAGGVAALVYAAVTLVVLAQHPYLLARTLLAPLTALCAAAAFGGRRWRNDLSFPRLSWVVVALAVTIAFAHLLALSGSRRVTFRRPKLT
jgi:hypothetical protein